MKKIFTLSMMAAAVLSMSATPLTRQSEIKLPSLPAAQTTLSGEAVDMPAGQLRLTKKAVVKSRATEEDVIGTWTLTATSLVTGNDEEFEVTIEPSTTAGRVVLKNFLGANPEGIYDANNEELHIPYQVIGYSQEWAEDIKIANTYISETGSVSIDQADIILYLDGDNFVFDTPIGFWGDEISASTSYGAYQEGIMTPGSNWENIGEATYTDFLLNYLVNWGGQEVPTAVKVQAQRSIVDPTVYRLVAPFYDWLGTTDNMDFWIEDNGVVMFPFQYLVTFQNSGSVYWASFNYLQGVGYDDGISVADFEAQFPDCNITFDADKKLIEIGKTVPASAAQLCLAYVDTWTQEDQPFYYIKFNDGSVPEGSIQLSAAAIANIMSNDPAAPVEYFNIMGQRVLNPAAGQMLIRRQGTEATKIVF